MNIKVLQINLNRNKDAHNVAEWVAKEKQIDIILASEENPRVALGQRGWFCNRDRTNCDAGIRTMDSKKIQVTNFHTAKNITWVEVQGIKIISCYKSPNCSKDKYQVFLHDINEEILRNPKESIFTGDFNSKHMLWGFPYNDERGTLLVDLMMQTGLCVCNEGSIPTFSNANGKSFIDVTASTPSTISQVQRWSVDELEESFSPHRHIRFEIQENSGTMTVKQQKPRWNARTINPPMLIEEIEKMSAVNSPKEIQRELQKLSKRTIKRMWNSNTTKKKPMYWWTAEIAEDRKKCFQARRIYLRTKSRCDDEANINTAKVEYKRLKSILSLNIKKQKERK